MEKISKKNNEEEERKLRQKSSDKGFIIRNAKSVKPYFRSSSTLIEDTNEAQKVDKSNHLVPRKGKSKVTLTPLS